MLVIEIKCKLRILTVLYPFLRLVMYGETSKVVVVVVEVVEESSKYKIEDSILKSLPNLCAMLSEEIFI